MHLADAATPRALQLTNKSDRIDAGRLSELLHLRGLESVYHGASALLMLEELVRSYVIVVEDATRVMLHIKAIFHARGIRTPGTSVYRLCTRKEWLARLEERDARMKAEALLTELDVLQELRPKAKAAMIAEARRQPSWKISRSIPFLGPLRVLAASLLRRGDERPLSEAERQLHFRKHGEGVFIDWSAAALIGREDRLSSR